MRSRMVCRSGGWLLLVTSLLLSHHAHGAVRRKHETVYVADPVGIPLSKPVSIPTKVGSPAVLIQPDRYEFYTFDESGELIKRLMTLQEIQEIIATGDGDDGHILTIAQSDINKPAVTINFQPPSNTKVHSIVSNVQNVLKSEMEAQKNNPPKEGIFDTPDVSSSWSQILPAIFGNTGGSIVPESLIAPHVGPETDFITEQVKVEPVVHVDKINDTEVPLQEKPKPSESRPDIGSSQINDLLDDDDLQSKTTINDATKKIISTTPEPVAKAEVKKDQTTPIKLQTTITYVEETDDTKTRPTPSPFTKNTATPTEHTTLNQIKHTVSTTQANKISPIISNNRPTKPPIKETTAAKDSTSAETKHTVTYNFKPSTESIKTSNFVSTSQATSSKPISTTSTKPSSQELKLSEKPQDSTTTLTYTKNPIDYPSTTNVKITSTTVKSKTPSHRPITYIPTSQAIISSTKFEPSIASTQHTTEKLIVTTAALQPQSTSHSTEKSSVSQKYTTITQSKPTSARLPSSTTKPYVNINRSTSGTTSKPYYYISRSTHAPQFTATQKATTETTRFKISTGKPISPIENVNTDSTLSLRTKISPTTEIQPQFVTRVKLSSSASPVKSTVAPIQHETSTASQQTTVYRKPYTTQQIKLSTRPYTSTTTEKYASPDIDINQIINQIVQDLGTSQQYDFSKSTLAAESSNDLINSKDEITTYRPNLVKDSEYSGTSEIYKNEFVSSSTKKQPIYTTVSKIKDDSTKSELIEPSVTTSEPVLKTEIKQTTPNAEISKISTEPLITKPSNELSESITNLISQIVNSKPTVVPIENVDHKSSTSPFPSQATENLKIEPKTTKIPYSTTNSKIGLAQTQQAVKTTEEPPKSSVKVTTPTRFVEISTPRTTQYIAEKSTTSKVSLSDTDTTKSSSKKPTTVNFSNPTGHYITRVSSPMQKPASTTNKFEIYKTSNEPTTTTIKKILTPDISTHKPGYEKISTSSTADALSSNKPENVKPLLPQNEPTKYDDENYEEKAENPDDFSEDAAYDGSETGVTHDDELMEMLNKYSEMFNMSPEVEAKSDETNDSELPNYEYKKVTSYKKTDLPEDEINDNDNISDAPLTEKSTNVKEVSLPITKISVPNLTTKEVTPSVVTEKLVLVQDSNSQTSSDAKSNSTVKSDAKTDKVPLQNIESNDTVKNNPIEKENLIQISTIKDENKPTEQILKKEDQSSIKPEISKIELKIEQTTPSYPITVSLKTEQSQPAEQKIENFTTASTSAFTIKVSDNVPQNIETVPFVTTEKYSNDEKKAGEIENIQDAHQNVQTIIEEVADKAENMDSSVKPEIKDNNSANVTEASLNKDDVINENSSNENKNEKYSTTSTWTLISTAPPSNNKQETFTADSNTQSHLIGQLHESKEGEGLEKTTARLSEDVYQFSKLCNELGFRYWKTIVSNDIDPKRSVFISPFAITSLLAMMFMATRGATSEEINEILKLDDMVTFNPHIVFKNVTESIEVSKQAGVATSAIIRELYSDRSKGRLLSFYKDRVQKFYNGHVEEINFSLIGDIIRRRTNLLVKRQTWSKIPEYVKHNNLVMRPPLAVFSANIFQTDCSAASTEGRDGEMYFVVSPTIRQRRLVPVPAVVYKSGFLAGYVTELDATAVAIGTGDQVVSTIFLMPGQQGSIARGDDIIDLEKRLIDSIINGDSWKNILKSLIPRPGLELQIPRLSHRSVINGSSSLQTLGLRDLFDPKKANLAGLNGQDNDLHVSDMILDNTFTTCGEGYIGEQHHIETYPGESNKLQRRLWRNPHRPLYPGEVGYSWDDFRDFQRAFNDPLHDMSLLSIPLHLRPRQARLPDQSVEQPRLKFDRPFMYFVRHNPTGLLLHMGRYNPRLLP